MASWQFQGQKQSLPSVSMSQSTSTTSPGIIESSQYLPLAACSPSLAFISVHDLAGSSVMEPRGTITQKETYNFAKHILLAR